MSLKTLDKEESERLKEIYEERIDNIVDIAESISFFETTVLTGKCGSGKSLVSKLLPHIAKDKLANSEIANAGMKIRTGNLNNDFTMLFSIRENMDFSTSWNTFDFILRAVDYAKKNDLSYIIIDTPELGLDDELVLTMVDFLNKKIAELKEDEINVLVITNNEVIVKNIVKDSFLNIEGMTQDEWCNRLKTPVNLDEWIEDTERFQNYIRLFIKKK